jgi:hypothetical protein
MVIADTFDFSVDTLPQPLDNQCGPYMNCTEWASGRRIGLFLSLLYRHVTIRAISPEPQHTSIRGVSSIMRPRSKASRLRFRRGADECVFMTMEVT